MNRVQQILLLSFVALILVFSYSYYLRRADEFNTQIPYLQKANRNFQTQHDLDDKWQEYNGTVTPWSLIFWDDVPLQRADDFPYSIQEAERLDCPDKYVVFNAMGGYNNQIIIIINALYFAHSLGRTLVLPDIHTDAENTGTSFTYQQFSDYFNIKHWQRTGVCVIGRREFLSRFSRPPLAIQYQFAIGYTPSVSGHVNELFQKDYDTSKMELKETFLDDRLLEDDIKRYFSENPPSSPEGAPQDIIYISSPLGIVNFPKVPHFFWQAYTAIFQSLHQRIIDAADHFINSHKGLRGSKYVAVHYRRMSVWANHCYWFANEKEGDYAHCHPTVDEALLRIKRFLRQNKDAATMFLSTNTNDLGELEKIQEEFRPKMLYPRDLGDLISEAKKKGEKSIDRKPADLLGLKLDTNENLFVDMLICAKADAFLANKWSTLSGFVQYQRLILGKDPATTHWW